MNNIQFHLGKKKTACQNSERNPEKKTRVVVVRFAPTAYLRRK